MLRRGADHCAQAGDGILGTAELQQAVREVELCGEVARLDRQNLPKAFDRALNLSFKQKGGPQTMQGARITGSVGQNSRKGDLGIFRIGAENKEPAQIQGQLDVGSAANPRLRTASASSNRRIEQSRIPSS